jgi:putative N6-adenine-specific DNA methylase
LTRRSSTPSTGEAKLENFFAPCPRGLEPALAAELRQIDAQQISESSGGVGFSGTRQIAWLANLRSRIASRILLQVAQGRYRDDDDLYRLANRVEWEHWFSTAQTLRIDVSAIRSPLRSLNFATLRFKDGLVDRFRTRTGERPSIDTENPDVRVFGFLQERAAVLYLDLSGEPLFKRGWRSEREDKGEAPLKENLAAGLLALAGWQPAMPLYDPFCGSGTIVIEAAQQALGIPPGAAREFAFERLSDFDAKAWQGLRADTLRRMRDAGMPAAELRIAASDADPQAVEQTRRNAERAGITRDVVQISVRDAARARPPFEEAGLIVTNPPYGERISLDGQEDSDWEDIGQALRQHFGGWQAWMLTSDPQLPRRIGMRERRRAPLFNGPIECRLFGFEIFAPGEIRPRRGARSPD